MGKVVSKLFGAGPQRESPTIRAIETHYGATQDKKEKEVRCAEARHAEEVTHIEEASGAEAAATYAKEVARHVEEVRRAEEARHAEEAARRAEEAVRRAKEVTRRVKEVVRRVKEEARRTAEEARHAEEASRAARLPRKAKKASPCVQKAPNNAEMPVQNAAEEASRTAGLLRKADQSPPCAQEAPDDVETAQEATEEQRCKDEDRAEGTDPSTTAAEFQRAKAEAEKQLAEDIRPVVMPSLEQLTAAKQCIQYKEDRFHLAVAGISGSGKSSLVNAFRGVRNKVAGAAAVGVTETTVKISRYPDLNPEYPYVWYDIPGAGTLKIPDWEYFNVQGLYVFDCIIVLFDNRFTQTDVAILSNARRFNIPTYIVRSKADQHIKNMLKDMEESETEGEGDGDGKGDKQYRDVCKRFIQETKKSVQTNLKEAKLPDQRVYIVSSSTLRSIVRRKHSPEKTEKKEKMENLTIDELDLLTDLLNEAYARRGVKGENKEGKALFLRAPKKSKTWHG